MPLVQSLLLPGLQPQPLASYLAALGVLRIASTQGDASVRGAFTARGFRLFEMHGDRLRTLLLDEWRPSPILAPWNSLSGFYDVPKAAKARAAMQAIVASRAARFDSLTAAILMVRTLVSEAGLTEAPAGEEKAAFIATLRATLPDDAVAWLDAVAVIDGDDARMMPLLGSGGNEGVLEYSGLFLRSLAETVLAQRERSARLLEAALWAAQTNDLLERPGGQFDPGTAGGFNTGPGFESKDLPNNPWTFLLLLEGAQVWASGLAARQQGIEARYRFAVSPFTVRHRAAGHGSAGPSDDDPQRVRAEVWVPVWHGPATLAEIENFIAEGRAEVTGRKGRAQHADSSLDFADAVASLGVDRGVDRFVRYAIVKRRGESFVALPAGSLDVAYRREADLLRQLDGQLDVLDQFVARFPSDQGPPAHLASLRRAVDDARFDVAARGGADAMMALLRSIGRLEMWLARRDPGKKPSLPRPLGRLGEEWVDACGDACELRLAAAIASLVATGGASAFRAYIAPVDLKKPTVYAKVARAIAWTGVDLADRLASVLQRRLLDARARRPRDREPPNPTAGSRRASLDDMAAFLAPGAVDDAALEELMFGMTWIRHENAGLRVVHAPAPPLPRAYALLKLLFLSHRVERGADRVALQPHPSIVPLLRAGRVGDALALATRELAARGFRPRRVDDSDDHDAPFGRRLAAALLVPVSNTRALLANALLPDPMNPDADRQENEHAR